MYTHNIDKSVVLVVDKYSQEAHIAYSTAGVKYPVQYSRAKIEYTKEFFSILADLSNVQSGVGVFFYRRRIDEPSTGRGFVGEWQAQGEPYEDTLNDLVYEPYAILGKCPNCGSPVSELQEGVPRCRTCEAGLKGHILPLRFALTSVNAYSRYLDDNTAYIDLTDSGRLSTLIFRKIYGAGRERSVNPILPEESAKLRRLLARVEQENRNQLVSRPPSKAMPASLKPIRAYLDFQNTFPISGRGDSYLYADDGSLIFETVLEFWIVQKLGENPMQLVNQLISLKEETVEWFSNQVLFGIGGEKSDVLVLTRDAAGLRKRAIVIELKKDAVNNDTLSQVKTYAYWIAQLATAQAQTTSPFLITPVAVGHRVARNAQPFEPFSFEIPYAQSLEVRVESPRVYTYAVDTAANTLRLSRVR
ncbi:MAG: hypothetical protein N2651_07990 [Fimbriimonadales bacterium]|nr:hypothetical protein [Fimbriimonadales bacterium]